jgi:hypothetical protein
MPLDNLKTGFSWLYNMFFNLALKFSSLYLSISTFFLFSWIDLPWEANYVDSIIFWHTYFLLQFFLLVWGTVGLQNLIRIHLIEIVSYCILHGQCPFISSILSFEFALEDLEIESHAKDCGK